MHTILKNLAPVVLPFGLYNPLAQASAGSAYATQYLAPRRSYLSSLPQYAGHDIPALPLHQDLPVEGLEIRQGRLALAVEPAGSGSGEIVFVDSQVEDAASLLAGIRADVEVIRIDGSGNGLAQMAQALRGRRNIRALHVISHGSDGRLQLGAAVLGAQDLLQQQAALADIGAALAPGADLLLYGCELAASSKGLAFIDTLAALTGTDVAASSDLTGLAALAGDWELEISTGRIDAAQPFSAHALRDFRGLLALPDGDITFSGFSGAGTNTLTSTYFTVTGGVDLNGGSTFTPAPLKHATTAGTYAHSIYLVDGASVDPDSSGYIYVKANSGAMSSFQLTGLHAYEYTLGDDFVNVHIVGILAGGGTNPTSSVLNGTAGVDDNPILFAAGQLTQFANQNLSGFKVYFKATNTQITDFTLFKFTVDNASRAPAIAIDNASLSYTENGSALQIDSVGTVSDADGNADWNGGKLELQITANAEAADRLSISDTDGDGTAITVSGTNILANGTDIGDLSSSGGTVTNGTKLTITFDADATNASVQEVLQSLRYDNTSQEPGTANRTITLTAIDRVGLSTSDTRTVTLAAVNDEPTLSANGLNPTFTEGDAAKDLFESVTASTIESTQRFAGLTLTVTNVNNGSDELLTFDGSQLQLTNGFNVPSTATNGLNVTVSVTGTTATVSFSGATLTNAALQTLVDGLAYRNTSGTPNTSNRVVTLTQAVDNGGVANSGDDTVNLALASTVTVVSNADNDGALTAAAGVTEPVGIATTVDSVGEAVNVFDFTLTDGGTADGLALEVSQIVLPVSGTSTDAERAKLTWRLSGADASNVTGTYNAVSDTLTFSGLSISVANGSNETYTINAFFNDNTGIADGSTVILSVDGDTNLTVGASGTQMGATSAVTNGTGSTLDVVASQLVFTTQPAGSVSGAALTTQPAVAARDAFGNTDVHFTETVTLTEASLGDLTSNTAAAVSGVATFSGLTYTATADQQSFTLTANDDDGVGSNLSTVDANAVTADVVATRLAFQTQPAPLTMQNGVQLDFSTDPVVRALDANDVVDTGFATAIVLAEVNGAGSATMTVPGDSDGSSATVTLSPSAGVATFTGLTVTYTNSGSGDETFNLRASSGALTTADSSQLTSLGLPTVTSATYDASTGVLVVTGSNLQANGSGADVDASTLTLTGEGGSTYTLTDSADVEIDSATQFTVTLSATDKAAINQFLNKNGTSSTGGTTYNVAAADDFLSGVTGGNTSDTTGNGITVSNVAAPVITSAAYDYSTNTLTLTGTGFLITAGGSNDIDVSTLTLTGEGGGTYTLISSADVEITSGTSAVITLSGADVQNVEALLNKNGTNAAVSTTTFNLAAAEDWNAGADAAVSIADASTGVTVSNFSNPAISGASYDAATGLLTVSGSNFVVMSGATNDIDASLLTLRGGDNEIYTLTDTADVELTSASAFTLTLSATDRFHVGGVLNKNGVSSGSGTTFNVEAADNWMTGSPAANDIADATGNGITVSNTATPSITSATYNAGTGIVVVTGSNLVPKVGASNDVDLSTLWFFGGGPLGDSYTLTTASDVELTSSTSFSFTLSGADKTNVDVLLDQLGTTSSGGSTYNITAADNWLTGADASANIADAGPNAVTVSVPPSLTSATYNASTGVLVVTGANFEANGSGADIDASLLTLTGEGGATYTLTDTANVERDSLSQFTLTLSATDKAAVNLMLNKNGSSSTGGTTYNLAAADDYVTAVTDGNTADTTGNGITVSNVAVPAITSATYDAATGSLVVTGSNLLTRGGASNDIDVTKLTLTGEGGSTYTLTSSSVEITGSTGFTVSLNPADLAAVNAIVNKNGTSSTGGTTYNLAAAEDWAAGADAAVTVADLTGNGVTASNVPAPSITGAAYDASSGILTVTGSSLLPAAGALNDIVVSKLTLTGEGGSTHTLTSSNVEITSNTQFSITLNAPDKAALNLILNKNGAASTGGTTYNLAAAEDWAAGADAAVTVADLTGNAVAVSNVAAPVITGAAYDYGSNTLTLAGTGFLSRAGAGNDIDVSTLTITGEGGVSYPLSSSADVEITSSTSATITLSGADVPNVEALLNKDGTSSATSATSFNLAAAEDWNTGADAAVNIADASTGITVSNFANPAITGASFDAATGELVIAGSNFVVMAGATNDIDASLLTLRGGDNEIYTLTDTADVELTSANSFTLTLSATDRFHVGGVLNKNGFSSGSGTTFNVEAADNWMGGSPAANDIADTTGNGITVSNTSTPAIASATYNSGTGTLVVTGSNLVPKVGAGNDIDLSTLTLTGGVGDATYTLTSSTDVELVSDTSFSVTLSGADKTNVDALLDQLGTTSSGGSTYNLAAADNWLTGADASADIADAGPNAVTVTVPPALTSATYDVTTGVLVVTGSNFQANGSGADIDASRLGFTGEGGETYTLTDTADVERDSFSQFTLTLSATDKAAVNLLMNKNGLSSTGGTTYNLAAADDYVTSLTDGDTSDATGNGITVSNVAVPTLTSATFDVGTGELVVTGSNLLKRDGASNDIDVTKLMLTGEGATDYTLTGGGVEITDATAFTVTLNATDLEAVKRIVNKDGTSSTGGTTYNLAAAEDWAAGADAAVTVADLTGNGVTASNVALPVITGASYSHATGILTISGSGFVVSAGTTNDIDASKLTLTGRAGAGHTLTATPDVEISTSTSINLILGAADKTAVNALLDRSGSSASDNTVYNLAAAEDWMPGSDAALVIADLTGNGISVTLPPPPVVDPPAPEPEPEPEPNVIDENTPNDGNTLTDVTITETGTVEGGTLEGDILNNGTVSNVTLAPGAVISGNGTLAGSITGDPEQPATISGEIAADTVLENVIIGSGSSIDPDAQLAGNVRFESLDLIPPGLELTGAVDALVWQSRSQTSALDLTGTLLANPDPQTDSSLLDGIRNVDAFEQTGFDVGQNLETGELSVNGTGFSAQAVPVSAYQTAPGTPPGVGFDTDGNIVIVADSGVAVVLHPAAGSADTLQQGFTQLGLDLEFGSAGEMRIQAPEGSGPQYAAKPGVGAAPAFRSTTPGMHFRTAAVPANVMAASLVYEDADGVLWEQEIVPTPADWSAVKATLGSLPGASNVRLTQNGVITVELNGRLVRAKPDYEIRPNAHPASPNSAVRFVYGTDHNGDGIKDYLMIFPDGSEQKLYLLP